MKAEDGDLVRFVESWNSALQSGVPKGADVGHHMIRRVHLKERVGIGGTKKELIFASTEDGFEFGVRQDLIVDPIGLIVDVLDCHQATSARTRKEDEETESSR
jgi:hypothetical protein